MAKRIGCYIGHHPCRTNSDDEGVWGECIHCHKRFGYIKRKVLREYIEAEEKHREKKRDESQ